MFALYLHEQADISNQSTRESGLGTLLNGIHTFWTVTRLASSAIELTLPVSSDRPGSASVAPTLWIPLAIARFVVIERENGYSERAEIRLSGPYRDKRALCERCQCSSGKWLTTVAMAESKRQRSTRLYSWGASSFLYTHFTTILKFADGQRCVVLMTQT